MSPAYPAKVLLLGEHTVLRGGRGLAVPYPALALRWTKGPAPDPRLQDFAAFLRREGLPLDHDRLENDLADGHQLTGNIPVGYGLGSSGAVCAAVSERYGTEEASPRDLPTLRRSLARMESFFHGSSSGTDPLVAYRREALLLGVAGAVEAVTLPPDWAKSWFLLDTGITRHAGPLIERFLSAHATDPDTIRNGWREPADRAIAALIAGHAAALYAEVVRISDFQLARFPDFIPRDFHAAWNGGDAYRLKLCGAGGGGMLLGLARDRAAVEEAFGTTKVRWLGESG